MENISERAVASVGNESPGDPPKRVLVSTAESTQ